MNQTTVMRVVCEPTLVPEYYSSDTTVPGPEFTIIVPTRNERDNILPVYHALCRTLHGFEWEAIFVDDDSEDGTPEAVRRLANDDRRVRCIQRIGRRGLASACVEGILASSARYVAVMDADLQHDERLLPRMLNVLMTEPIDVVVGSRYVEDGSIGTWDRYRAWLSNFATLLGRRLLGITIADPMSGFFIVRREAFQDSARRLSNFGFKILLDILASSPQPLRVKELPFEFRERHAGESKFDSLIGLEYLMLLVDKLVGHVVPIRFVLFSLVGSLGLLVHLAALWVCLAHIQMTFAIGQAVATSVAMVGNFVLNNWLTYRDRRLVGWKFACGLLSFMAVCSVGAIANVGIATVLFDQQRTLWWVAGIAGASMSTVWNYAVNSALTWRAG